MVTITARYDGDLRCTATHGPSQSTVSTDAPADNAGKGELFSPTDLVATALATCAMTTMAIVAGREQIPFDRATATVVKHMVADPSRRIGRLPLTIVVPGKLTDVQRKKLEAAAHACPVHKSLGAGVDAPITFEYPDL